MIRIPYPIPEFDQARLIQAGQAALTAFQVEDRHGYRKARQTVDTIIEELFTQYGVEE